MPTAADYWRWEMRGFAKLVLMLQEDHADPSVPPMPPDVMDALEGWVQSMAFVLHEQRQRAWQYAQQQAHRQSLERG